MAVIKRQWRTYLAVVAFLTGVFLLWDREGSAHPGSLTINSPRTFASLDGSADDHDGAADGTLTLHGDLTIDTGGSITCNDPALPTGAGGCNIVIVGSGKLEMKAGSVITSENLVDGGGGGDITITVAGDLILRGPGVDTNGAIITSRKDCLVGPCGTANGGKITLTVGNVTVVNGIGQCNASPSGDVLVEFGATITSDSVVGRAGDILVWAGRNITIDGRVSAEGFAGSGHGGEIWLDACCNLFVGDDGVVTSRGQDPGPDRVHLEACVVTIYGVVQSTGPAHELHGTPPTGEPSCIPPERPGKPTNSTACVEIWSGTTILIDSTGTHHGQVNADTALSGGTSGLGWIDILANLLIRINDGTGNDHLQHLGGGGDIPVNHAVHANQYLGNGHGGDIAVLSKSGRVETLGNAISANDVLDGGDGGGFPAGTSGVKVEAGGAGSPGGDVSLDAASIEARGAVHSNSFGGKIAVRSWNGDVTGGPGGLLDATAGVGNDGMITLTSCVTPQGYSGGSTPAATVNAGLAFCGGMPTLPSPADTLLPSSNCFNACNPVTPTPTPTATNTRTTPTVTPTPGIFCNKQSVTTVLAGRIPDIIVRTDLGGLIQPAVDNVTDGTGDGYLIVGVVNNGTGALGGHVYNQSVVISKQYSLPFLLIGCSVTLHDPTPGDGNAVIQITSAASSPGPYNIFVMDLHAADSGFAGIDVQGPSIGRYLRNENVLNNAIGFKIVGNNNTIHNGAATGNGVGVWISGDNNIVTDTNAYSNTTHGVQVVGNSNRLLKIDSGDKGKGNGQDGYYVMGTSNWLQEDDAFGNGAHGFQVAGDFNTIYKGRSGDSGKGNGGDGYNVAGTGNSFQESRAASNLGDGWDVSGGAMGSPNKFKLDLSNTGSSGSATLENTGPEYRLLGYVQNNGGGNKADSITIPAATKCPGFPTSPNSANVNFACGD